MAAMKKSSFINFTTDFSEFKNALKKHVNKYKDPRKVFITSMIKRIPFFADTNHDAQLEILYGLKEKYFFKDDYIINPF